MGRYEELVERARAEHRRAEECRVGYERASAKRARLLHEAWEARPGGTNWFHLMALLFDGLPEWMHARYSTVRRYAREGAKRH